MKNLSRDILSINLNRSAFKATIPVMAVGIALGISACGAPETDGASATSSPEATVTDVTPEESTATGAALAVASLADVDGNALGEVTFTQKDGSLQVSVLAEGMDPGFYGFHVHEMGKCEVDSAAPDDPSDTGAFKSAGGHIPGQDGAKHPNHAGDLPTLLVGQNGTATMTGSTDRLDESLLMDPDGSAVVIHSKPDNFANIPERYAANGPDEDTTGAGDAGERLACGVVES